MSARSTHLAPAGIALALTLAACTGGGTSPSASVAPATSVSPSTPTVSSAPSAATSSAPASPAAEVQVTAVDFAFEGVPAEVTSGTTLGLTNAGQEVHEMIVVRKPPTTSQSFEELLAMPQQEVEGLVEDVGFAFAEPGTSASDVVTVGEPGDYLMICFIPAGTTSLPSMDPASSAAPSLGTGAPHFTLGMLKEFKVAG